MTKQVHVIAHTHWDFEWYFSAHESLIQLIYHLDEVMDALEKEEVETYYLDGQLSIVEDYLHACPQQKTRFCHLVKEKKLLIGPWYTQTCQLIIAGESIVRNLQLGISQARALGGCEMLGYVPDSFGQSMDMPKIYKGFGIENTVFWRGLSQDVYPYREGLWQSEDGSQVYFYNIKDGYYVGGQLIYSDCPFSLVSQVEEGCLSTHIALPLGGDQRFIDRNVKARIALFNETLKSRQSERLNHPNEKESRLFKESPPVFKESTYEAFFASLKSEALPLDVVSGEMIDGQVSKIHRSIYSSRSDHKRLNDALERRLTLELEPLMALATLYGLPYKDELVRELWRTLTRNHAHDSAGGCNTDKTNKIILERFEKVDQMSSAARDYIVRKLALSQPPLKDGARLTLFNTLPVTRNQVQTLILSTKSPAFSIHSMDGVALCFNILAQTKHYSGSIQRDAKDEDENKYYYQTTLALRVSQPGLGFISFSVHETEPDNKASLPKIKTPSQEAIPLIIENQNYKVTFQDGEIHIEDKKTGQTVKNALSLRDGGDDGDTYDYSPPRHDKILHFNFKKAKASVFRGHLKEEFTLEGALFLPKNLHSRAKGQYDCRCEYRLRLSLTQDENPLQIDFDIDNQAEDHRLQCVFNTPIKTQESLADTPFGFARRPHFQAQLSDWRERGWKEAPSGIYPLLHYANLHDKKMSLTVMAQGIKEYEVLIDKPGQACGKLALTLFRSVGFLGKPDLERRPGIASGQQFKSIPTPDSQMKGLQSQILAVSIDKQFNPSNIMQKHQAWSVNTPYYQDQSHNQFTNTIKYFVMHPLEDIVPEKSHLMKLNAPELICSAIQYEQNAFFIRLYNPSEHAVENAGEIFCPFLNKAAETNLLLEIQKDISVEGPSFSLGHFRPKQVRTFKMQRHPKMELDSPIKCLPS